MKTEMTLQQMMFRCRDFTLDFSQRPRIMSVLNLTPDSFSDGGKFYHDEHIDFDAVCEVALQMERDGADILDIGGESTRPGATPVSADEEKRRILPAIERISKKVRIPISVDTTKASVAEAALRAGASIVNDISGFRLDKDMTSVCARFGAAAIVMHLPQRPEHLQWSYHDQTRYTHLVEEVKASLSDSIRLGEQAGIASIAIDVGFGFGKSVQSNFELLGRLAEFRSLGRPILVGLSRKSFIGKVISKTSEVAPPSERLFGTIAANTIALMNGANLLRVHDTKAAFDAVQIFLATQRAASLTESMSHVSS